jgi:Coenzyme PQQ synthesis protein D (PqqD)
MIAVTPNLRSIVDHDGAVILDISRDSMTTLDTVGAYIWNCLGRGLSVDAIVAELARDTGADQERVAKDLDEFMEQLKARHLVLATHDDHPGAGFIVGMSPALETEVGPARFYQHSANRIDP